MKDLIIILVTCGFTALLIAAHRNEEAARIDRNIRERRDEDMRKLFYRM
jgi:hypothetical protein